MIVPPEAVVELGPLGQAQTVAAMVAQEESLLAEAVEEGGTSVLLPDKTFGNCRTEPFKKGTVLTHLRTTARLLTGI